MSDLTAPPVYLLKKKTPHKSCMHVTSFGNFFLNLLKLVKSFLTIFSKHPKRSVDIPRAFNCSKHKNKSLLYVCDHLKIIQIHIPIIVFLGNIKDMRRLYKFVFDFLFLFMNVIFSEILRLPQYPSPCNITGIFRGGIKFSVFNIPRKIFGCGGPKIH